jgi:hypothetical protein
LLLKSTSRLTESRRAFDFASMATSDDRNCHKGLSIELIHSRH